MSKSSYYLLLLVCSIGMWSCGKQSATDVVHHPAFSSDSAYSYIEQQLQFGNRIPNTHSHRLCVAYLAHQLRKFGAEVSVQQGQKINYAGQPQPIMNIIGRFPGREGAEAVLLCAHYDTRPWSDEEEEYDNRFLPLPGANDGASGVGVLLEIARQIGMAQQDSVLHAPIEIVFFDCEDMGTPDFYTGQQRQNTWCLGSQFWSEHFAYEADHVGADSYEYGILLDMVGAPGATFPKEYYSMQSAGNYVEKIWRAAAKLGYQKYFVSATCYPIVDDHYYVSSIGGFPCVDIIHYDAAANAFPYWWHTQQDDMRNIDKNTLQAVGETVLLCLNY